jgi:hypothetical protein
MGLLHGTYEWSMERAYQAEMTAWAPSDYYEPAFKQPYKQAARPGTD